MDPNQALQDARKALAEYNQAADQENSLAQAEAAEQLASAFQALDQWLAKGGFLPIVPSGWHAPQMLVTLSDGRQVYVQVYAGARHVLERSNASDIWSPPLDAGTRPHQRSTFWLGSY